MGYFSKYLKGYGIPGIPFPWPRHPDRISEILQKRRKKREKLSADDKSMKYHPLRRVNSIQKYEILPCMQS